MNFFACFALLLAISFLGLPLIRPNVAQAVAFRKALGLLLGALVIYYPISDLFFLGPYLGIAGHPVGFVLALLSFRLVCLELVGRAGGPTSGSEVH